MLSIKHVFLIYVIKYIEKLTTWSQKERNSSRHLLLFDRMQAKMSFCLHKHFKEAAKFRRKWTQARLEPFFRRNTLKSNAR